MTRAIICFIDDSPFEHDLVREAIAPAEPDFEFIQAYTFDEASNELNGRIPSLFLLDLWGKDEETAEPVMTTREELEMKLSGFPTLEQVYEGLEGFQGDRNNEYLKRLFTIVDGWRRLFQEVCARMGQNGKYGLGNLKQARSLYPDTVAVFYTRKSLIDDAVAMFQAGADGLFIKPTGKDDHETWRLTREYAPSLLKDLKEIIATKRPAC